jgi:hypothetical protein
VNTIKETIKKSLPLPVLEAARNTVDAVRRLPQLPGAWLHPWRRETMRRLTPLKDQHRGERCFVIGNGPSLKETDLSHLKSEHTFGMNRIFLGFKDLGFTTTYYVSMNDLVIEQSAADIQKLPMPKFINWRARKWLKPADDLFYLFATYTGAKFSGQDIRGRIWEGATVTYVALQVAYYLGYQQVILIGVDHNYATTGKPNETVISQGDDPNHFHPGYFGQGFRWQLPDLDTNERSYAMARKAYEADGREILDATVGGKLQVFKKVPYESLFG